MNNAMPMGGFRSGPHNRLAAAVAVFALALSALAVVRVVSAPPTRVASDIAEQERAILAALDDGSTAPPAAPNTSRPAENRRPVRAEPPNAAN